MKKNPQIDVILFDLGSTLIFFDGDVPEKMTQAYKELADSLFENGIAPDRDSFLNEFLKNVKAYHQEREIEFIEHTTERILRNVLEQMGVKKLSRSSLRPYLAKMYSITQSCWKVEDDTHATLQVLKDTGYRMGIISNAGDDWDVQVLIDNAGIRSFFDYINTSASAGIRKPHPRIFEMAFSSMQVKPCCAVMIGDTLGADILGAKNLGMHNIWITRRASQAANKAHHGRVLPDREIASLSELPQLLEIWPE